MKRFLTCSFLLMLLLAASGCDIVGPGYAGIKVNNMGEKRGVQDYTARTGLVMFCPVVSSVFEYPTFVQTAKWEGKEEVTFNTKEGTVVSGDVSLAYELSIAKLPAFYVKFRSDNLDTFTHGFLRNIARDAFNEVGSSYLLEEIYGAKKEQFMADVKKRVMAEVGTYGVNLVQFGFLGKLRMDPLIMTALNNKLVTTQNAIAAENKLREANATAANIEAYAEGQARANMKIAASLTPELIQWKTLEINKEALPYWNGGVPYVIQDSGNGMLLQMPTFNQQSKSNKVKKAAITAVKKEDKGLLTALLGEKVVEAAANEIAKKK